MEHSDDLLQELYLEATYSPYKDNSKSFKNDEEFGRFVRHLYKGDVLNFRDHGTLGFYLFNAYFKAGLEGGIQPEDLDVNIAEGKILVEDFIPEIIKLVNPSVSLFNQAGFVSGEKFYYKCVELGKMPSGVDLPDECQLLGLRDQAHIGTVSNLSECNGLLTGDVESDYDIGRLYPMPTRYLQGDRVVFGVVVLNKEKGGVYGNGKKFSGGFLTY